MLLMIDNYDSFTYNLVQYFGELGTDVETYRNDEISLDQIEKLNPDHICISPVSYTHLVQKAVNVWLSEPVFIKLIV